MSKQIDVISADKLRHYIKGSYSGSFRGMRYFISSKVFENETRQLSLCIWPEPYCLAATPDEQKEYFFFDFTDEGLLALEEKLNIVYEEKFSHK